MLGESLRKLFAEIGGRIDARTTDAPLVPAPRPTPSSARALPHESAALHVTGQALYTDDLVGRTSNVLHAHPVQAPHRPRACHRARRRRRRTPCRAWSGC